MSFMNSSRTTRIYNTVGKKQSLVFIGDSITWGAFLQDQSQTFEYKIQQHINSKYGFTPATWGGQGGYSSNGIDIVARNITIDDAIPYSLYTGEYTGGSLLSSSGSVFPATFGMYPFSASTGISGRSIPPASGNDSWLIDRNERVWTPGAITLGAAGSSITFNAHYPSSQGYLMMGVMGAGQYQVLINGSPIGGTQTTGAKFTANGYALYRGLTDISMIYGTIRPGDYIYADANALSSPFGDTAHTVTSYTFPNLTMSDTAPLTTNYTFWALEGSTQRVVLGPFNTNGPSSSDTIEIRWIDFVPVFTMLHPTVDYPSTYTTVQINGRNGYSLGDYSSEPDYPFSGNADVAAKQIMATVIHNDDDIAAGKASRPTYVLSVGVNDMPVTSVSAYKSRLKRLANALQNTNYRNYGKVVLTVPINPIPGRSNFDAYRRAVIDVASELKCSYVDLSLLNLTSGDYLQSNGRNDGLHPGPIGTTKIANYYIKMLGL